MSDPPQADDEMRPVVDDSAVHGWIRSHWPESYDPVALQARYAEGRRAHTEVIRAHYSAIHNAAAAERDALEEAAEKMRAMDVEVPE